MSKNLRKVLAVLAAASMCLSMAACSASSDDTSSSSSSSSETSTSESSASDESSSSSTTYTALEDYSEGIDDNGFYKDIVASDYVTLPDSYDKISVEASNYEVSDDDVMSEIKENYLANVSTTESYVTDREVKDGDTVNIDYVGSVDGVEFTGGTTNGSGTDVTIGTTQYIDDFLDQLVGHKPGETINVEVTFPDGYSDSTDADGNTMELANKDAVFVTKINYIIETNDVEITDDLVKENLSESYGWNTVDEMKAGVKAKMENSNKQTYVQDWFSKNITVDNLPDAVLTVQERNMINYYTSYANNYGVTLDSFLSSYVGVDDVDTLKENQKESNTASAKYFLALQAVAEKQNISVSEDDIKAYFLENMSTEDYSTYEDNYGLPYIKMVVLENKVLNWLTDNAVTA